VEVWPPHVVALDLPGESGSVEAVLERPALVGMWRRRAYKSMGEVQIPRSQLSGPGPYATSPRG
jgi:hypothetical protein